MKPYPYTHVFRDRHGKTRVVYRRNGKAIPLKGVMGTAEFQAEYDHAKALLGGKSIVVGPVLAADNKVKVGTLRWLCIQHFCSPEFAALATTTQGERRRRVEHMTSEPSGPDSTFLFGDYPVARMEAKHIRVLRDNKKDTPTAANHRIQDLRTLFRWAIENDNIGGVIRNPAADVPKLKIPNAEGYHSWSEEEQEQFKARWPVGSMARLAFEFFRQTGQRVGDVREFGPRHVRDGKLFFTQEKNRHRHPIALELEILPDLQEALDATKTGDLRFLVSDNGRPFASKSSFGNWFRECCHEAGLPHCSAHGLRKASATFHANNSATASELMAVHGWRSLRVAEGYVRKADQKRNAARAMERARAVSSRRRPKNID
jgi:integrase